jgi:hypothetical protein
MWWGRGWRVYKNNIDLNTNIKDKLKRKITKEKVE